MISVKETRMLEKATNQHQRRHNIERRHSVPILRKRVVFTKESNPFFITLVTGHIDQKNNASPYPYGGIDKPSSKKLPNLRNQDSFIHFSVSRMRSIIQMFYHSDMQLQAQETL